MNIIQIKEIELLLNALRRRFVDAKGTGTIDYLALNLIEAENVINALEVLCSYAHTAQEWTPKEIGYEQNANGTDTDFFIMLDKTKRTFTLSDKQLINYNENEILNAIADFLSEEYKIKIKNNLNDLNKAIKNAQLINKLGGK